MAAPKVGEELPLDALGRGAERKRAPNLQRASTLKTSSSVQSAAWTPGSIYTTALLAPPGALEGGGVVQAPPPCLHPCITVRDLTGMRAHHSLPPAAPGRSRRAGRARRARACADALARHSHAVRPRARTGQYKARERVYRGGSAPRLAITDALRLRRAHQGQPHGGNVSNLERRVEVAAAAAAAGSEGHGGAQHERRRCELCNGDFVNTTQGFREHAATPEHQRRAGDERTFSKLDQIARDIDASRARPTGAREPAEGAGAPAPEPTARAASPALVDAPAPVQPALKRARAAASLRGRDNNGDDDDDDDDDDDALVVAGSASIEAPCAPPMQAAVVARLELCEQLTPQRLLAELSSLRAAHGGARAQLGVERARLARLHTAHEALATSKAHWRVCANARTQARRDTRVA
jgi:hypothetical protein